MIYLDSGTCDDPLFNIAVLIEEVDREGASKRSANAKEEGAGRSTGQGNLDASEGEIAKEPLLLHRCSHLVQQQLKGERW